MSPTESQATDMPAITLNGQALPNPPARVQMAQPKVAEPMGKQRNLPPFPPPCPSPVTILLLRSVLI